MLRYCGISFQYVEKGLDLSVIPDSSIPQIILLGTPKTSLSEEFIAEITKWSNNKGSIFITAEGSMSPKILASIYC